MAFLTCALRPRADSSLEALAAAVIRYGAPPSLYSAKRHPPGGAYAEKSWSAPTGGVA